MGWTHPEWSWNILPLQTWILVLNKPKGVCNSELQTSFCLLSSQSLTSCHPWRSSNSMSGSCGPKWGTKSSNTTSLLYRHTVCLFILHHIPLCVSCFYTQVFRCATWQSLHTHMLHVTEQKCKFHKASFPPMIAEHLTHKTKQKHKHQQHISFTQKPQSTQSLLTYKLVQHTPDIPADVPFQSRNPVWYSG